MLKHGSCYTNPRMHMLKHELLHRPRMHMPKHEAAAWFEVEDAETELSLSSEQMLRHSGTATMLKHEP
jgi:hypothetical protein